MSQTAIATEKKIPSPDFYTWQDYRCAYEYYPEEEANLALLLIHPVGVGLSRQFWHRFCQAWTQPYPVYNPDLLGCGDSQKPHVVYTPQDWADQLNYFLNTVIQKPVVVVVQGALCPVAIKLVQQQGDEGFIKGLIFAGPPAWELMNTATSQTKHRLLWNIFDSPLGKLFYRYARRRQFLKSFSVKELFEKAEDVDQQWLDELQLGASDLANRYAVFSFLSGFWREDYGSAVASIQQPTLVLFGETASSISNTGKGESPEERMIAYAQHLPNGQAMQIPGRNVLPYESTEEFISAIAPFISECDTSF
jgi:pimeloyl-ACP methyl ester carboxylesterase